MDILEDTGIINTERCTIGNKRQISISIKNVDIGELIPFGNSTLPSIVRPIRWKKDGTRVSLLKNAETLDIKIFGGASRVA